MTVRDVLIVGAGPTGMLLAALLAERGLDVALVERRVERSAHSRAIGIHPPGLEVLAAAGVGDQALKTGLRIPAGRVLLGGRDVGGVDFAAVPGDYPFVLSLPQQITELMLERRIVALGVPVLQGDVRAVEQADDSATVTTERGELRARLVVGADGVRSTVRRALGLRWHPRPGSGRYLMADLATPGRSDVAAIHLHRDGVVEALPLPGDAVRWVARSRSARRAEHLAQLVRYRTGIRINPMAASMVSSFTAAQHIAGGMVAGRVVLLGDSAHQVSPIGGQGMTLAWTAARDLADLLPAALDRPELLGTYEHRTRARARRALAQAWANTAAGAPAIEPVHLMRSAAVGLVAGRRTRDAAARAFAMTWAAPHASTRTTLEG